MKWKVEYIASNSCNILIDSSDEELVGIGFPQELAERIVSLHNEVVDALTAA